MATDVLERKVLCSTDSPYDAIKTVEQTVRDEYDVAEIEYVSASRQDRKWGVRIEVKLHNDE